jgi:hypothetical protein
MAERKHDEASSSRNADITLKNIVVFQGLLFGEAFFMRRKKGVSTGKIIATPRANFSHGHR